MPLPYYSQVAMERASSAAPTADDSAASTPRFLAFRERGVWRGCRMVVGPRQRGHRSQADSRRCRRRVRKTPRRAVGFRDHRRFDRRSLVARFQGTWKRPDRAQVKQANPVLLPFQARTYSVIARLHTSAPPPHTSLVLLPVRVPRAEASSRTTAAELPAPHWRTGAHEKNVGQRDPAGRTARRAR